MRKKQFSKSLTVALPGETYSMLQEQSDEENISIGELVRALFASSQLIKTKEAERLAAQAVAESQTEEVSQTEKPKNNNRKKTTVDESQDIDTTAAKGESL